VRGSAVLPLGGSGAGVESGILGCDSPSPRLLFLLVLERLVCYISLGRERMLN